MRRDDAGDVRSTGTPEVLYSLPVLTHLLIRPTSPVWPHLRDHDPELSAPPPWDCRPRVAHSWRFWHSWDEQPSVWLVHFSDATIEWAGQWGCPTRVDGRRFQNLWNGSHIITSLKPRSQMCEAACENQTGDLNSRSKEWDLSNPMASYLIGLETLEL